MLTSCHTCLTCCTSEQTVLVLWGNWTGRSAGFLDSLLSRVEDCWVMPRGSLNEQLSLRPGLWLCYLSCLLLCLSLQNHKAAADKAATTLHISSLALPCLYLQVPHVYLSYDDHGLFQEISWMLSRDLLHCLHSALLHFGQTSGQLKSPVGIRLQFWGFLQSFLCFHFLTSRCVTDVSPYPSWSSVLCSWPKLWVSLLCRQLLAQLLLLTFPAHTSRRACIHPLHAPQHSHAVRHPTPFCDPTKGPSSVGEQGRLIPLCPPRCLHSGTDTWHGNRVTAFYQVRSREPLPPPCSPGASSQPPIPHQVNSSDGIPNKQIFRQFQFLGLNATAQMRNQIKFYVTGTQMITVASCYLSPPSFT